MASASRGKNTVPKDITDQFCAITGAPADVGERLLEACNGNLDMAIGMHMDGAGGGSAGGAGPPAGPSDAHQPAAPSDDEVRAPIPQRNEVLVHDMQAAFGNIVSGRRRTPRSVFDGLRDFQAEARQQELELAQGPKSQKQKTLEDLFRPPIDLMFKGSFHAARDLGTSTNKWLMVNVQNAKEFQCQMLNRDVWSTAAVKALVKEHFIFWQVYNDSEEGRKYMQFYKIHQWPYIAVLDPRTGENLVTWNNVDPISFCELVTGYLSEHHQPDPTSSPDEPAAKRARKDVSDDSIVDASEDSQLQAAIRASMRETKVPDPIVIDSDDDLGSDQELETFSDSADESDTPPAPPKPTTDSVNSEDIVELDKEVQDEVTVVKSGSSSPIAIVTEPTPRPPLRTAVVREPKPGPSSDQRPQNSRADKQPVKQQRNHCISTAPSTSTANSSSGSSSQTKDCTNGSHSSSNGSTEDSPSQQKFQFVKQSEPAVTMSSWRDHLGDSKDAESIINIRFPDGKRQQFKVPCSSKLRALIMFVQEEGYHKEMYELVTNFPKRRLSYLDIDDSLQNHGLFPQETVFVQER